MKRKDMKIKSFDSVEIPKKLQDKVSKGKAIGAIWKA